MPNASQSGQGARPFTFMGMLELKARLMALFAKLSMYCERALAVLEAPFYFYFFAFFKDIKINSGKGFYLEAICISLLIMKILS